MEINQRVKLYHGQANYNSVLLFHFFNKNYPTSHNIWEAFSSSSICKKKMLIEFHILTAK
jgi:hypothetical protein